MRLLCLDLATKTGWACGTLNPCPKSHGVIRLPKTGHDIGRFLAAYREWLGHAIEEMAPSEIMFESPILPEQTGLPVLRKLYGLAGQTELTALDYKIPVREANLNDIRRHFIGTARAPKAITTPALRRRWIKDQTIAKCRHWGFNVSGDDDADAIALLSYGLSLYQPGFVLQQVQPVRAAA